MYKITGFLLTLSLILLSGKSFAIDSTWLNKIINTTSKGIYVQGVWVPPNVSSKIHIKTPQSSIIDIFDEKKSKIYSTVDNFGFLLAKNTAVAVAKWHGNKYETIQCAEVNPTLVGNAGFDLLILDNKAVLFNLDPAGVLMDTTECDVLVKKLDLPY
ncbi:hypothetical protein ACLBWS_04920 [Brucellaceae bacterium D45D]